MKKMKKAAAVLLALCLFCPCISTVVHAAAAQLQFSDPATTVGAEVEVKVRLASSASIKTLEASLSYDKEALRFISGDSAAGGDGAVTISGEGNGPELIYMLKFQALKETATKIEVASAAGTTATGEALEITNGSSAVTIGPGDPSLIQEEQTPETTATGDGASVTVNEVPYTISNDFSDALIPEGFSKAEMTFEGSTCQAIKQDASDAMAMYLAPAGGGDADFFLYNSDKGSFSPFEIVDVSQDRYIILLNEKAKLSKEFQETTLTLNGKEFPVWQNTEKTDYYVVYALNSDGEKMLYQYDNVDKTYQRYTKPAATAETDKTDAKGLLGKVTNFVTNNLKIFLLLVGAALLLLFIILLVVAVKLRHRNIELDDLYDEYGIDEEEPAAISRGKSKSAPAAKKQPKQNAMEPAVRKPEKKKFEEDDFDDFDDSDDGSDLMDDDFDTFEEADFDDEYEDAQVEDEYYDDSEIEDLDSMLSEKSKKKRGHAEDDDAFKVDFIDLD